MSGDFLASEMRTLPGHHLGQGTPRLSETKSIGCHDVSERDDIIYQHACPFSAFYSKRLAPGLSARDDDLRPASQLPDLAPWVAYGEGVFISPQPAEKQVPRG